MMTVSNMHSLYEMDKGTLGEPGIKALKDELKENCFWDDWMQNAIKVYSETEITDKQVKTLKELGVIY